MKQKLICWVCFALFCIPLSAQTIFWGDRFDNPGTPAWNNGGVGWAGGNTPGGGSNTTIFGTYNDWTIGTTTSPATICSGTGAKLYIRAFGTLGSTNNTYFSDCFTDKHIASPNISTVGQSGINLTFDWRCDGIDGGGADYGKVGVKRAFQSGELS
jgi:hypothetical protein